MVPARPSPPVWIRMASGRARTVTGPTARGRLCTRRRWEPIRMPAHPSSTDSSCAGRKLASPMNSATNRLAGVLYSSRGLPICDTRPRSMTTIRSEMARASA